MGIRVINADCRDAIQTLQPASVQAVITSPPYYRLRDYGVAGQIGREVTPGAYIAELVDVFDAIARVLRPDGTVWLNLGDCYANGERLMIPPRVVLALKDRDWVVRDEIIWHKPRATPSSVTNRTASAHEMLYLLTRKGHYVFNWEAIEEPSKYPGLKRKAGKAFRDMQAADPAAASKRPSEREIVVRDTRRKRSVWAINPEPYKAGGHFATMPTELAEICMLAGTKSGDTVLDPFSGVGTTGLVADRLQRDAVLIELSPKFAELARQRITDDCPMFADVA